MLAIILCLKLNLNTKLNKYQPDYILNQTNYNYKYIKYNNWYPANININNPRYLYLYTIQLYYIRFPTTNLLLILKTL